MQVWSDYETFSPHKFHQLVLHMCDCVDCIVQTAPFIIWTSKHATKMTLFGLLLRSGKCVADHFTLFRSLVFAFSFRRFLKCESPCHWTFLFELWMIFFFLFVPCLILALAAFDAIVLTRSHLFLDIVWFLARVSVCGVVVWILAKEFILCANKECVRLSSLLVRTFHDENRKNYMILYVYTRMRMRNMYRMARVHDRYMKYGPKFVVKINNNQTKRVSVYCAHFVILFRVQPWASNEYGVLEKRHI